MRSDATTVDEYLAGLPDDRRAALEKVRAVILDNLAPGFEEAMNWGMITYEVPLEINPDTYNGKPLMYAALASQKRHMAVYLTSVYQDPQTLESFLERYQATGKRLDMGKSCVRFRRIDDLPIELIGDVIGSMTVDEFVTMEREARTRR